MIDLSKFNDSYYLNVLKSILGHLQAARGTKDIQKLLDILKEEAEKSVKEDIRASVLPTSVSKKEGRNFYLPNESLLSEEEVEELIDDLSGVFLASGGSIYLLKIKNSDLFESYKLNVKEQGFEKGIDTNRLLNEVETKLRSIYIGDYSNIALFLLLNDFVLFLLNSYLQKDLNLQTEDEILNKLLSISKDLSHISGVFTVISRQKKRKYYLTNLSDFILKFYKKELKQVSSSSIVGSFLFSFYILDSDFRDKALGLLDKLLYYLIFKHQINWQILCQALNIFFEYDYKKFLKDKKKPVYIKHAKDFFVMMNLEKIYDWAYAIGSQIKQLSPQNGQKYIEEIIKEIKKEELPGKFKEELAKVLFKVSEKLKKETGKQDLNLSIHPEVGKKDLYGDEFYKVKAAILSGFINSL